MKRELAYDEMKEIILDQLPSIFGISEVQEVVAISRGGITIAHIIAKELKLPVGYYMPDKGAMLLNNNPDTIMIVEDLIAEGRTTKTLHDFMKKNYPDMRYMYVPFLVDESFRPKNHLDYRYDFTFYKTPDWIVFPWETMEGAIEGDRGLFRNSTDKYGRI